jgi:uncharacterized protein (TIGR03435 family)
MDKNYARTSAEQTSQPDTSVSGVRGWRIVMHARYDLDVIFRGEGARSGSGASAAGTTTNGDCPEAFSALPSQLGLRLESHPAAKGSVDYLVISHVERPTAN